MLNLASLFVIVFVFVIINPTLMEFQNEDSCGIPHVATNVSDTSSQPGQWPWHAAIFRFQASIDDFNRTCSGVLISTQWVLTAAHCLDGAVPSHSQVALGDYYRNVIDETEKRFAVSEITCHEEYKVEAGHYVNNICLLKLASRITFNDYIVPACLTLTDTLNFDQQCITTGWGQMEGTDNALLETTVHILNRTSCDSSYTDLNITLTSNDLCARSEGITDTCFDYGGGPLVCYESSENPAYVLKGIGNVGLGCGSPGRPGLYTNIGKYLEWIQNILNKTTDNSCFVNPPLPCGTVVKNSTIIRNPIQSNESWLYPPNSFCQWIIEAPLGYSLLMDFQCFLHIDGDPHTGCRDKLTLDFGLDATVDICGTSLDVFGNESLLLPLNEVTLQFISDSEVQSTGFLLQVSMIPPTVETTTQTTTEATTVETTASTAHFTQPSSAFDTDSTAKSSHVTDTSTNSITNLTEIIATTINTAETSQTNLYTTAEASTVSGATAFPEETNANSVTATSSSAEVADSSESDNDTMEVTSSSSDVSKSSSYPGIIEDTTESGSTFSSSSVQTVGEEVTTKTTEYSSTGLTTGKADATLPSSQPPTTNLVTEQSTLNTSVTTDNGDTTTSSAKLVSNWSHELIYVLLMFVNAFVVERII